MTASRAMRSRASWRPVCCRRAPAYRAGPQIAQRDRPDSPRAPIRISPRAAAPAAAGPGDRARHLSLGGGGAGGLMARRWARGRWAKTRICRRRASGEPRAPPRCLLKPEARGGNCLAGRQRPPTMAFGKPGAAVANVEVEQLLARALNIAVLEDKSNNEHPPESWRHPL